MDVTQVPAAPEDELDLVACALNGAPVDRLQVTPDHFDNPYTRSVWQAILKVDATGGRTDPVSVRLAMGPSGDKAATWLLDVFGRPVVASNADALAAKVRRTAQLRDLQSLAIRINQQCLEGQRDPGSIAEMIRAEIDKPMGAMHGTSTFGDALPAVIDELESGRAAGLSTPWPDLDRRVHGLQRGALYIVAARPGVGKSLLGQNLAVHWSRRHQSHTYFASVEMKTPELVKRALAQTSHVEMDKLMGDQRLRESDWEKITTATAMMQEDRVHICDNPLQTLDSIRAGSREIKRRHGLGLIVVDYLQIVTASDRRMTREQQVAETSRGLKIMAKELDVPIVAMAQLRRLQEAKPSLNDLRESGAIEQDADAVLLLHIPNEAKSHEAEMLVAKARAGTRGPVRLELRTHWASVLPAPPTYVYGQEVS